MLSKKNILLLTVCSILCIAVTTSTPIDIQDLIFDPISYPGMNAEDDYADPVSVFESAYRKAKRQTSNMLRQEGEDDSLPDLRTPFTSQKMKQLLQILKKPKKSGIFTLNGWSASGMPFNVLYSPNTQQQKLLAAVNVASGKKPSMSGPKTQPLQRENDIVERKEDKKEDIRGPVPKTSSRSSQLRRHYLVIPQLFVSYGWGSVGK